MTKPYKKVHLEIGSEYGTNKLIERAAKEKDTLFIPFDIRNTLSTLGKLSRGLKLDNLLPIRASTFQIPLKENSVDTAHARFVFAVLTDGEKAFYDINPDEDNPSEKDKGKISEASRNVKQVLDEVHRVLKDEGTFEIEFTREPLSRIAAKVIKEDSRFEIEGDLDKIHENPITLAQQKEAWKKENEIALSYRLIKAPPEHLKNWKNP